MSADAVPAELTFAAPALAARQQRLRWRSRRSLLELDILLERFWQRQGEATLDAATLDGLEALLALEDHELWGAVSGREVLADAGLMQLIGRLRLGALARDDFST